MEESVEVRKDGKKHIVRNVLLIAAACSVPATFVCVILCGNMRTVRNKMLDAENGKAKSILRAAQSQVDEYCYSKNGRSIPANREYIVRYYVGDKGWVNEPCELLPDSIVNQYYTTSDTREKAVVKFVDGKACEAWHSSRRELADDMLRFYSFDEQKKAYSYFTGTKNVIGYYNAEQGDTYIH